MIKRVFIAMSVALATGLSACSPVGFLNTITPSDSFDLTKNVAYGDLDRQELDVYRAKTPRSDAPVLVYIHGGSWGSGDKNIYKFIAQAFTAQGYDIVIPNYRLYPDVIFPAFIEDAAQSVAWTARQYPERPIIIMGQSAGAHSAASLGLNPKFLEAAGVDRCARISGVIGLAGPYGERPFKAEPFITIFPDRNLGDDAPLNLVDNIAPPFLLLTGAADTTVHPRNSPLLADAISERGGVATSKDYPGVEHSEILKYLSRYFDEDETVKADMLAFIAAQPTETSSPNGFCQ